MSLQRLREWRFAGWPWLLLPALTGLGLCSTLAMVSEFRAEAQIRRDAALALIPLVAQAAAPALATGDTEALGRLARLTLRLHPQVSELEIRSALDEPLADARAPASPERGLLGWALAALDEPVDLRFTLESTPKPVVEAQAPSPPTVRLTLHPTSTDALVMSRLRRFLLCAIAGLMLVLAVAAYGLSRMAQIQRGLLQAAHQLAQGRLEARAPVAAAGLTGQIGDAINRIGRQLLEMQDRQRGWLEQETGRLKRELADARARLQVLELEVEHTSGDSRVKSELYAQISHELRTPLAAIVGYSDLLRQANLPAGSAGQVETLAKSAHGLLSMVNDLLDWSRIEAGHLQLNDAPFDIEDCIDDVIALLAPLAYDKRLELVHILYHDVPRQLLGDAQRIKQVLTNLLSNAIKFTAQGEVVLRVMKEREEPRQLGLLLRVSDTGAGLAPEQQRLLFQPYRQLGAQPGSGLGLVITRRLAELMGGSVSLESTPGQGATFSASLTLARQPESSRTAPHDELRGRHIWVCEPHATARLALMHSLDYWGVEVRELSTLQELAGAISRAGPRRPDLVVLGLSAQQAELLAQAGAAPLLPVAGTPVLCLVASASQSLYEALRLAGATRCLPKSTGRSGLYQHLLALMSGEVVAPAQLAGRRVLVAEHNLANRRYVVALLQGLGADTLEAADGREAIERWAEARPDLVLLDIHMPVMDGPSAAREIRSREGGGKRSLIVGISAYLDATERRALALAGMDGDLLKPFDERQLLRLFARRAPAALPAQEPSAQPRKPAGGLAQDGEMRALLRSELPLQLGELEEAVAGGETRRLRDAVHQLHGTAAFYRLPALKLAAAALETRVVQARGGPLNLVQEIDAVRAAVAATLKELPAV